MKTNTQYIDYLKKLLHGTEVTIKNSQGDLVKTLETLNSSLTIPIAKPIVTIPSRKLNYRFMCAEAWWILSGSNTVADIIKYNTRIADYSDDGNRFFGAYGPKVTDQLLYVVSTLKRDPASRRAVINIWRESPGFTKDTPCSLSLQFIIRDNKLHCIYTMRSSDAFLGVPYDIFNMSMIATVIAIELNQGRKNQVELGNLTLNAASGHLYETNLEKIRDIIASGDNGYEYKPLDFNAFGSSSEFISHLKKLADRSEVANSFNCFKEVTQWT